MAEGITFKGKKFLYEGSVQSSLNILPVDVDGNPTGTTVVIDSNAINLIRSSIIQKGRIQMGACRDNPARGSLGELLLQNGKSPQFLSYVLPLLEKEGFLTHNREGNAFWVSKAGNYPRNTNEISVEVITPNVDVSDNDETSEASEESHLNITANMDEYLQDRGAEKRYASFDYCYNYFRNYYDTNRIKDIASPDNMQLSCLQLGFYLASWGMLRGSSFLLQKSIKHYEPLIHQISKLDKAYWEIDADKYTDDNINLLIKLYELIEDSLGNDDNETASATLVTKIMLGVFANVPALDEYFCTGFGYSKYFSKGLLRKISNFYLSNKFAIDSHQIKTLDFDTGNDTSYLYTKAKIIDMIGFIEGLNINNSDG